MILVYQIQTSDPGSSRGDQKTNLAFLISSFEYPENYSTGNRKLICLS